MGIKEFGIECPHSQKSLVPRKPCRIFKFSSQFNFSHTLPDNLPCPPENPVNLAGSIFENPYLVVRLDHPDPADDWRCIGNQSIREYLAIALKKVDRKDIEFQPDTLGHGAA